MSIENKWLAMKMTTEDWYDIAWRYVDQVYGGEDRFDKDDAASLLHEINAALNEDFYPDYLYMEEPEEAEIWFRIEKSMRWLIDAYPEAERIIGEVE